MSKKYTLFWLDGKKEVVQGDDIADAFRRAGYFGGAIRLWTFLKMGKRLEMEQRIEKMGKRFIRGF